METGIPSHPVETTARTFEELGLSPELLATVREIGFEHPTPIQEQVIPPALEGRDLIALAMTGSGKDGRVRPPPRRKTGSRQGPSGDHPLTHP
jgi:ATP-dependent RNA helicase RhlE